MSLFLAIIAALTLEVNSWIGYAWYGYYKLRYSRLGDLMVNLGPVPVPAPLVPFLPYIKAGVALLGVVASVLIVVLGAGAPAFAYVIVSLVTALGVYTVPNSEVKAILQDGVDVASDAEDAYHAAQKGDVASLEADLHKAELAANGALGGAEVILKGVDPVLAPLPPLPPKPAAEKPLLPSEMPTPPQPVKPKPDDPQPPPHSGVIT